MDTFQNLHEYHDISIGRLGMHELSEQELDRIAAWIANAPLMRPKSAEELANSQVAVLRHGTLIRAFATLSPLPSRVEPMTLVGSVIANPEPPSEGMARRLMSRIAERTDTGLFAVSKNPKFIELAQLTGFTAYEARDLEGSLLETARLATPDLSGKTFLYRPEAKTDRTTFGRLSARDEPLAQQ